MTDDTIIDAGSETSGESAVDTSVSTDSSATEPTAPEREEAAIKGETVSGGGEDAEGAPSETTVKAGDSCVCPDGRTGTVHSYDEGLICIPNADQG